MQAGRESLPIFRGRTLHCSASGSEYLHLRNLRCDPELGHKMRHCKSQMQILLSQIRTILSRAHLVRGHRTASEKRLGLLGKLVIQLQKTLLGLLAQETRGC